MRVWAEDRQGAAQHLGTAGSEAATGPVEPELERESLLEKLHLRLSALSDEHTPDPAWSWARLERRLPERRPPLLDQLALWARRPAVAVATAAVLGTSAAYAAGAPRVRETVERLGSELSWAVPARTDRTRVVPSDPTDDTTGETKGGQDQPLPERDADATSVGGGVRG